MPDRLDFPEFRKAWSLWIKHRSEIKKPLKLTQAKEQLHEFELWGPERSIAAIKFTIRKGWQGIREEETRAGPTATPGVRPVVPKLGGVT